jgi:hypothetical protein
VIREFRLARKVLDGAGREIMTACGEQRGRSPDGERMLSGAIEFVPADFAQRQAGAEASVIAVEDLY